ncbi:MAG TPA: AsnC family transcriptional regulator [Candidatus Thermoplasmatota archaeon]|nr:AsnC family transcriptional regulator [Candidatus Thermoplasmatota archaeon]
MDELDLRILGCLPWKPGDPIHMARGILRPWDIARTLGVHGNTVKTRLEEMRRIGVLKAVYLVPNALVGDVTDLGVFWLEFDGPREKLDAFAKIQARDDVNDVHTYVGGTMRVALMVRDGADLLAAAEQLRRDVAAHEARLFYRRSTGRVPGDPTMNALSALDLRIVRALLPDAHRPFPDVAKEVGVTPKTVRLRFHAMLKQPTFAIIPHLDLGKVRDFLAFELSVELAEPNPSHLAAFTAAFPQAFNRGGTRGQGGYVYLAVRSGSEMEDVLLRAQAMPGVRRARALLVREVWTNNGNLLRILDERLAEAEREAKARK